MAIINCNECGKEISNTVKVCPHCGYKLKRNKEKKPIDPKKKKAIIIVTCIVMLLCFGGIMLYNVFHLTASEKNEVTGMDKKISNIVNYDYSGKEKDDIMKHIEECKKIKNELHSLKWKEQIRITGKDDLTKYIGKLEEEIKMIEDEEVKNVVDEIASFGEVTLDSKIKIIKISNLYNALTEEQKTKVNNYEKMAEYENTYVELTINNTIQLIDNIGTVKLSDDVEEKIDLAKDAYNLLSEDSKERITNYSILQKKDEEYNRLSSKKNKLLDAQEALNAGNLNNALKILRKLPKSFSYKGTKVSKLLKLLNRKKAWVALCGRWVTTGGQMRVTQTSDDYGSSHWWYRDFDKGEYSIDVRCKLNKDGSITVITEGYIPIYTKYSSIRAGIETDTINIRNRKKKTGLGTIRINKYTTLTLSTSGLSIVYNNVSRNEDVYFTYTYRTAMDLKKKKKSY